MKRVALVALIVTAVALVMTDPLVTRLARALPGNLGDPLLNAWIVSWNAQRFADGGAGLWQAPIFFPHDNTLAYSENLLGVAALVAPVYWVTGNGILAYNLAVLASFVLAGVATYLLVYALTGRPGPALVAALAFAFCPYRTSAQVSRIQVLMTGWMPLALWALHRYFGTARRRWLVVFASAFLLQGLSSMYFFYFLTVPVALIALHGLCYSGLPRRRVMLDLSVAAGGILLAIAPLAVIYRDVQHTMGFTRTLQEVVNYSARIESYGRGWPTLAVWSRWAGLPQEETADIALFPGVTLVLLAALACWPLSKTASSAAAPLQQPRFSVFMKLWRYAVPAAAAGVAALMVMTGSYGLGLAIALWLLLCRATLPFPRQPAPLYGLIAVWTFVLSFGPIVRAGDRWLIELTPYRLLMAVIPGLDGLRAPSRFGLVMVLALAVLAGLTLARWLERRRPFARAAAYAAAASLILAEGYGAPIEVAGFDPRGHLIDRAAYEWLRDQPPGAVLELPMWRRSFRPRRAAGMDPTLAYQYGTLLHGHPIVNGVSGFEPPLVRFLAGDASPLVYFREVPEILRMMRGLQVKYLVVHQLDYAPLDDARKVVSAIRKSGDQLDGERAFDETLVFRLKPLSVARPTPGGLATVPPGAIQAETIVEPANAPAGASPGPGRWLQIRFDRPRDVALLRLEQATDGQTGYPHELVVRASDPLGSVSTLLEGSALTPLGYGLVTEPTKAPVQVALPPNRTQTLWLRQAANRRDWPWTIDRLTIWERASPEPTGSGR